MPITTSNSRVKEIMVKAGAAVGAAAILTMFTEPVLAETPVNTATQSTFASQSKTLPGPSDKSPEEEFTDAVAVVNQYWTNHFTDYFTGSYTPPNLLSNTSVRVPGIYNSDVEQVPCGQGILDENNANYCRPGDFIAADDKFLHNQDQVGDSFVWLVVAHEWGHAIQARLQPQFVPQWDELQADCFAGAALAGATKDETVQWDAGDNQELYNSLKKLADKTPWTDSKSHGDASQRIGWYNHGVENNPLGCLP